MKKLTLCTLVAFCAANFATADAVQTAVLQLRNNYNLVIKYGTKPLSAYKGFTKVVRYGNQVCAKFNYNPDEDGEIGGPMIFANYNCTKSCTPIINASLKGYQADYLPNCDEAISNGQSQFYLGLTSRGPAAGD